MIGRSTKVRFVGAQKIEHCTKHGWIAESGPQGIGRHPGQRQQPFGPRAVGQDPAQRGKRQSVRVVRGLGFADNCGPRG